MHTGSTIEGPVTLRQRMMRGGLILWGALMGIASYGCRNTATGPASLGGTTTKQDVEVSPGTWVTVTREDSDEEKDPPSTRGDTGMSRLAIPWRGRAVMWQGNPIVFSLRAWQDNLYMIALDRSDIHNCRFRYYRQRGDGFVEMAAAQFPRRIATQNLWRIDADELDALRRLDAQDTWFCRGLTASVWRHLLTGVDYQRCSEVDDRRAVGEFKMKYGPIPLPGIRRECGEEHAAGAQ